MCVPGWVGQHHNNTLMTSAQHDTVRPHGPRDQVGSRAQQLSDVIAGVTGKAADVVGGANLARPEVMSAAITDFVQHKLRMQVTTLYMCLKPQTSAQESGNLVLHALEP